jgi:hypothetical protein
VIRRRNEVKRQEKSCSEWAGRASVLASRLERFKHICNRRKSLAHSSFMAAPGTAAGSEAPRRFPKHEQFQWLEPIFPHKSGVAAAHCHRAPKYREIVALVLNARPRV